MNDPNEIQFKIMEPIEEDSDLPINDNSIQQQSLETIKKAKLDIPSKK